MSMLHEAHDFMITGGEFIGQQNVHVSSRSGIDILLDASTPEAAVDAGEREYCPSCYPKTRDQYIEDITTWATASNGDHLPVYWMRGPAGVGKSAIAQTCAQKVKDSGHLGAAFFFSVNGRRSDHTRFFPTLAYQLSTTLPGYRENVDRRILKDKTLVAKTMKAQFESLIVDPLRELREQGKEVRRRPIFIDGLDECRSEDAQVEIIKIIVSSIQDQSTPFFWAVFSRAEPHIVSAFTTPHTSPLCCSVYLPISRDSDKEIELYLRSGFENILGRRSMVLSLPWPSNADIKKLVDAAAGLFAYCATVLRFIDTYSYSGFQETLQAVLEVIAQPGTRPIFPFADLDKLYSLILRRVPEDILPSMQLLLSRLTKSASGSQTHTVALDCNILGITEIMFKSICSHLQAVIMYRESTRPFQALPSSRVDFCRSYFDQDPPISRGGSFLTSQILGVHGTVTLLHKSFNDFLLDPNRSSTFCVYTQAVKVKFLGCVIQQHQIASNYIIQGLKLTLSPGATSSSVSLSWPQGTEFVDSFLKLLAFRTVSSTFADIKGVFALTGVLLPFIMMELHYRKSHVAARMMDDPGMDRHGIVLGYPGLIQRVDDTTFGCLRSNDVKKLNLTWLLTMVKRLETLGIIKAFHPRVPSAFASVFNFYSQNKPGKQYGLYELGCGEQSVVWYWEFDAQERYYHEFRTTNYAEAMRIYETEKFKMWKGSWIPPSSSGNAICLKLDL